MNWNILIPIAMLAGVVMVAAWWWVLMLDKGGRP